MADYDVLERSLQDSHPLEVYLFALGTDAFAYTSRGKITTVGSVEYVPESIARSAIEYGADSRSRTLTVTVPASNAFARRYVEIVPGRKATLSIFRLQRDETPTFATQTLWFKGEVQSVRFTEDGQSADIALRSLEGAKSRNIPRFTFMGSCNHFLYSPGCGVDSSLFNTIGIATAGGDTSVLTHSSASGQVDGYWRGGYATPTAGDQDFRLILAHSGSTITLLLPFSTDVTGQSIQLFAGCDHDIFGDCSQKFDNVLEYGGHAFVPRKNIFETGL